MTINSQNKGRAGEQDTVRRWRTFGFDLRRQPNSGGLVWKGDLWGKELADFHMEVKYVERLNIEACMDKARSERKTGQIVLLIHKRNRRVPLVTIEEQDFMGLMRELMEYRSNDETQG